MANTEVAPADTIRLPAVTENMALISIIERAARDPSVDMDKMDRLLVMHERMTLAVKEQAFNDAMAAAQAEMEPIRRDCDNPQTRSKFASYAALDRAVRPVYSRHGFGVSFNTQAARSGKAEDIGVVAYVTCNGFTRLYELDMPADGKGAKGGDVMTRTHATGSGLTYGRRYLLQMIFNLATETGIDDDGNSAGRRHDNPPPLMQQRKADPNSGGPAKPPVDPFKPHKMEPLVGDTFQKWRDRFVAHINGCTTIDDLAAWDTLNADVLGKIHAKAQDVYATIDAAFARCRERVAKTQQSRQASTEDRNAAEQQARQSPTEPSGAVSDKPLPKSAQSSKDSPKPPSEIRMATVNPGVTITNIEGFIKDAGKRYEAAKDVSDLIRVHERDVASHMDALFPTDRDEILRLYRLREAELSP